jgi:hypothetical protein
LEAFYYAGQWLRELVNACHHTAQGYKDRLQPLEQLEEWMRHVLSSGPVALAAASERVRAPTRFKSTNNGPAKVATIKDVYLHSTPFQARGFMGIDRDRPQPMRC